MKSLELNWIRKKVDKTIPIPEVMFFPFTDKGGCYYSPYHTGEIYDHEGKPYSVKYGLIAVCSSYTDEEMEGVIAHEWRHHWQKFNGVKYDSPICNSFDISKNRKAGECYDKLTRQYFMSSKAELDALRFEYKYAGGFKGGYSPWEELLSDFVTDLKPKKLMTFGK